MANFIDRIQFLKLEHKLLQKDMAKVAEISLRTYQRYESGERIPDLEVLIKLADYFNVSTDYLLGRSNDPTRHL